MTTLHAILPRIRGTLILLSVLSAFHWLPAASAQPPSPAQAEAPIPPELMYKWELKEVRYKDGRPSFVPQHYSGVTLSGNGMMTWSDGCNSIHFPYRIVGSTFSVGPRGQSTLILCSFAAQEDVHYAQVTQYELAGHTLYLHTPAQVYVLERFPYSPMSLHAWSLYSITDRQTGEELNVDRFRTDYTHLLFRVDNDATFHFTDLDREEFAGALHVEGETISGMAYDHASEERLRRKPIQYDALPDSTQRYQKTAEPYPTTYAQLLHWEGVRTFKVSTGTVQIEGKERPSLVLELATDTQLYRFIPR